MLGGVDLESISGTAVGPVKVGKWGYRIMELRLSSQPANKAAGENNNKAALKESLAEKGQNVQYTRRASWSFYYNSYHHLKTVTFPGHWRSKWRQRSKGATRLFSRVVSCLGAHLTTLEMG